MDHLPFPFLKHPSITITLSALLLISFCCCYSYIFSSTILTLLVLALPTSFPFIFSKIKKQLQEAGAMEEPPELLAAGFETLPEDEAADDEKATLEEEEESVSQINDLACSLLESSLGFEGQEGLEMDRPSSQGGKCLPEEANRIPLQRLDSSFSDDETSPENASQLSGCSECSISDDDSLIEIALSDGHYLGPEETKELFHPNLKEALLPDFSPEAMFRQPGLMELLSEINEEDNLIEIDITMGCIKCSRVGIKA